MSFLPLTDKLTAGAYLRKRREAAGLSIQEVAAGYAVGADRDAFVTRLARIEQNDDAAGPATLDRLVEIFRFDREIYRNLVAGLPAGTTLCRSCCCSWNDACRGSAPNCHWAEPDLCSRCAIPSQRRRRAKQEPSFTITASDPHAIAVLSILAFLRLGEWDQARKELDEVIGEGQARARMRAPIDRKGGEDAAAMALDMTVFRDFADTALKPGSFYHV
jgi:hypothetical protein